MVVIVVLHRNQQYQQGFSHRVAVVREVVAAYENRVPMMYPSVCVIYADEERVGGWW